MDLGEHGNKIRFFLGEKKLGKASKEINSMLKSYGLANILDMIDSAGCRVAIKKKEVSNQYKLIITNHARERTNNYLKMLGKECASDKKLSNMFMGGSVVEYSDLLAYGYRPNKDHSEESTYVEMKLGFIAVTVIKDEEIIWITTLSELRTPQHMIPISETEFNKLMKRKKKQVNKSNI